MVFKIAGLALACLLAQAAPAAGQDMSVLLQSVDNVEKRVNRLEAEIQKLKKAGKPEAAASPAASAAATGDGAPARTDSMRLALSALEARVKALEAPLRDAQAGKGDPALTSEVTALAREMKVLAAALRPPGAPAAPPAAPAGVPAAAPSAPKTELALSGNLQIHAERKLTQASGRDNLDLFWGRINIGLDFKDGSLQSKVNVRVFPEGFGFDPLTGISYDTTGQGSLKTQTEAQAKVQINNAWAQYTWPDLFSVRAGRIEAHDSPSETFGHYIDGAPGGKYLSRKPTSGHNGFEFISQNSGFTTSLMLAAADRKLNHGYLRIQEKFVHASGFQAALGWRANVFDRWQYPEEDILQRYAARLGYGFGKGMLLFAEAALLQLKGKPDEQPVLAGFQCPVGKAVDLVSVEAEFLPDRKAGKGAAIEDKPLLFNLYARKKLWQRLNFDLGLFSDAADPDASAFGFGLRMTSSLK